MIEVEVLEIFPKEDLTAKDRKAYQARGNCHVKLPSLGLHVRNISYRITHNGKISVKPPFRVYSVSKKPAFVNSVEFESGEVWKTIESKIEERITVLGMLYPSEQLLFSWDLPKQKGP